jgi:hypothetical protein
MDVSRFGKLLALTVPLALVPLGGEVHAAVRMVVFEYFTSTT